MKSIKGLPLRNLLRRPARSAALLIISAFLALSAFGGSLAVLSLQNGLNSLEARLGADIIVVPYEATTQTSIDSILLQGKPGYFYMDSDKYDKIQSLDGIEQISAQFYLASAKAGCCSFPIQIIGFDPETDFSVQPWLSQSYGKALRFGDIVVGSDVTVTGSRVIKLYDMDCNIVGVLDKTGTELDTAVYTNKETIVALMKAARDRGLVDFGGVNPDNSVSSVLINVKEGYPIDSVVDDINIHVRKVQAIRTKNMISGVAESLSGVSGMIGVLMAAVWLLSVVILMIVFSMIINERRREFAVLRVLGMSRGGLAAVVFREALLVSLCGGVCGVAVTLGAGALFAESIEQSLGLPFLMPSGGAIAALAVCTLAVTVLAGAATSAISAFRVSRIDTGLILRGDNG